jgi:hypothetical protein
MVNFYLATNGYFVGHAGHEGQAHGWSSSYAALEVINFMYVMQVMKIMQVIYLTHQ